MGRNLHRVLVIGVGSIGERHTRCFQGTGRAQVGICEINDALRERIAGQYQVAGAFSTLDGALAESWDVAVICTPADSHVAIALKLLEAGIHVLIEKPLAASLEGVEEVQPTADRHGRHVAVAYVYRAHPVLTAMREALASGRFGNPLEVTAVCGQNFPYFRPAYREIYYRDHAKGGGAIQDALTHIVNAVQWLVGPIERVCAQAEHLALPGVSVEDTVHVLARHGGIPASYSLNQFQMPNEVTITVNCERGTVRFEAHENRWRWCDEPCGPWHDEPTAGLERDTLFVRQAEAFLDAVEGSAPPLCTVADGLLTLKANLAILKSARAEGEPVVL